VRITAAVLSLLILSLIVGPSLETGKAAGKDLETIIRLEREWVTAFLRGEAATVDRMETASFTAADSSGQVTKAEQLKSIEQRQKRDLGATFTPVKQDVRFFGDVALLTGLSELKLSTDDPAERTQLTVIWVRQAGAWKVEHFQEVTVTTPR
jgi:ketosteroid isomerase-like protein